MFGLSLKSVLFYAASNTVAAFSGFCRNCICFATFGVLRRADSRGCFDGRFYRTFAFAF